MGKTIIFSDVVFETAMSKKDIIPDVTYTNEVLKSSAIQNYYVNNQGIVTYNRDLSYFIIPISGYEKIKISGHSGTNTGVFLSSETPSTSAFVSYIAQTGITELENYVAAIPAGATHFALNIYKSYNNYELVKFIDE